MSERERKNVRILMRKNTTDCRYNYMNTFVYMKSIIIYVDTLLPRITLNLT